MKNKILICFGTRPEWLKVKPLIKILDKSQYSLLFTGQHLDLLNNIDVARAKILVIQMCYNPIYSGACCG